MKYDGFEPVAKLHAEMMCLLGLKDMDIDFHKVKLYIYREDKNGNLANCRPCAACISVIDRLGIKYIYYTIDGGFVREIRDNEANRDKIDIDMNFRCNFLF